MTLPVILRRSLLLPAFALLAAACGGAGPGPGEPDAPSELSGGVCRLQGPMATLDARIDESSGIVRSRLHPGLYWTHNDSGGRPELFAVDREGRLMGRVTVPGVTNRDWEDVAYGPCGTPGEALDTPAAERHRCLWIGEFGDNRQVRDTVFLYRVPEPHPDDQVTATPDIFPFVYADGPRDAEALFFDELDRAWVISKGRPINDRPGTEPDRGDGRITAYRLPVPLLPGIPSVAEPVQTLSGSPPPRDLRVTAGASSPSGRLMALRTYVDLQFYRLEGDTLSALLDGRGVDLRPLREPQGEGIDVEDDGSVVLSSEGGLLSPGTLVELRCDPEAGGRWP